MTVQLLIVGMIARFLSKGSVAYSLATKNRVAAGHGMFRHLTNAQRVRNVHHRFSSISVDNFEGDEDEDDDDESAMNDQFLSQLEALQCKDYDVKYLQDMKERGDLILDPFYQRGFKWSQTQSSAWIESIIRGYPCLPEITLLTTIDENGDEKYAVFDGKQRLTSIMNFIGNHRGIHWRTRKNDDSFKLENLTLLKNLNGMTFQGLPKETQNRIKNYGVRCAVIPQSWSLSDYTDYFKRIQGGGTPMTPHELRRALSQGPFTELLDQLASDELILRALKGSTVLSQESDKGSDKVQELLLRYFQYRNQDDTRKFGKPTFQQNGLDTMKFLNREMKSWTGKEFHKRNSLVDPLKKSLNLILTVFGEEEAFRVPVPLLKDGKVANNENLFKVWVNKNNLRKPLWDCTVAVFARDSVVKHESTIRKTAVEIRYALISLMQSDPVFTNTLLSSKIDERIHLFEVEIFKVINAFQEAEEQRRVTPQQRLELIKTARNFETPCGICGQPLSPYDDHLHIDHTRPLSKGGTSSLANLEVVHKTCNLEKSNKFDAE